MKAKAVKAKAVKAKAVKAKAVKAKAMKAERTIIKGEYTCVVCGQKTIYPYGMLERYGKKRCVCTRTCNEQYLKGEYNHDG